MYIEHCGFLKSFLTMAALCLEFKLAWVASIKWVLPNLAVKGIQG